MTQRKKRKSKTKRKNREEARRPRVGSAEVASAEGEAERIGWE